MTSYTYIIRDALGRIIRESATFPGSALGLFRVCQITGEETRCV